MRMGILLNSIIFLLFFKSGLMLTTIASNPDFYKLTANREKGRWSLQSDYQKEDSKHLLGDSEEDLLGDSEEDLLGDSEEYLVGDSEEDVLGDSEEDFLGDSEEDFLGDSEEFLLGDSEEDFLGNSEEEETWMELGDSEEEESWLRYSMGKRQRTHWPLQAGYPGLAIKNLNKYISLFSHCLVNIQNYQGIEIIGIKSPVYLTRFDVANLKVCDDGVYYKTFRFFFGKIPPKSEQNCSTDYSQAVKYAEKSMKARWYCTAQFDLFFPEDMDAPHIVYHSQRFKEKNGHSSQPSEHNLLFDIAPEHITFHRKKRNGWSKTNCILICIV